MFTALNCIPCFFRQLLKTVQDVAPGDEALHRRAVLGWAGRLAKERLTDSPPAVAGRMYAYLAELTGVADMFAKDKQQANAQALELLPAMRALCGAAPVPLKRALEIAVIGNYMDSGVEFQGDWEHEIATLEESLDARAFEDLAQAVDAGGEVLILGDNAGEIVLDMLLVEELLRRGARVAYAVRGGPILNDATMEDARQVGMCGLCEVVASGVDTPGTVLERCSPEFAARLDRADVVLSKGQGNFEALCVDRPDCYFAFKVKCELVSRLTGRPVGQSVLCRGVG